MIADWNAPAIFTLRRGDAAAAAQALDHANNISEEASRAKVILRASSTIASGSLLSRDLGRPRRRGTMRTKADVERWKKTLWNLRTDIQRAEGDSTTDLENMVRFAWLEAGREMEAIESRERVGWPA